MESKPYGSELCRYMFSKLFLPINEGSKEKYMLDLPAQVYCSINMYQMLSVYIVYGTSKEEDLLLSSYSSLMMFAERWTMDIYYCKSNALLYIFQPICSTSLLSPVNCSDPTPPTDGSTDPYQNTTEGAEIFFRCNPGFVPARRMRAVCGADGRWNPDLPLWGDYHSKLLGKCSGLWGKHQHMVYVM